MERTTISDLRVSCLFLIHLFALIPHYPVQFSPRALKTLFQVYVSPPLTLNLGFPSFMVCIFLPLSEESRNV